MGGIIKPMDIEKESFRIISEELGQTDLSDKELLVLKREYILLLILNIKII